MLNEAGIVGAAGRTAWRGRCCAPMGAWAGRCRSNTREAGRCVPARAHPGRCRSRGRWRPPRQSPWRRANDKYFDVLFRLRGLLVYHVSSRKVTTFHKKLLVSTIQRLLTFKWIIPDDRVADCLGIMPAHFRLSNKVCHSSSIISNVCSLAGKFPCSTSSL